MLKNYIKIAWRNLWKNKGYATINIIGLSAGMAAVLIIAVWIQNQLLYDNFYTYNKDLYKLWNKAGNSGDMSVWDITSAPAAESLEKEYPEVLHAARMYWSTDRLLSFKETTIKTKGNAVDPQFLQLFDFPSTAGNITHMMDNKSSIVLTASLAKNLFGNEDPLNKTIALDNEELYTVTGVLKDLPSYTDFDFTYLIPLTSAEQYSDNWNTNTFYTYVRLREGTNSAVFNKKIEPLVRTNAPDLPTTSLFLYPMSKMHLYSRFENGIPTGGKIEELRLVAGIGVLILLIACINFVNLSTARSQKRSKEVGVRKVIGASKNSLVQQFLAESVLLALIAGVVATGLALLVFPLFNQHLDKPLAITLSNPFIWLGLLFFSLFTGVLAGVYPAFFLSRFKPVKTLKASIDKPKQFFNFRELLVVFQFGIAVILIIATLIVRMQIQFASERNIGYDISHLIEIPVEGDISKNYAAIKAELVNKGLATNVTRTGWTVTHNGSSSSGGFSWEGATPEQRKNMGFELLRSESDLIKTLGLTLLDGRDIDFARLPADSNAVLLNEAAIQAMKLENPIGKYLQWSGRSYTIVGVFKDFIMDSPYSAIAPTMVYASKDWMLNMVIRMNAQVPLKDNLQQLEHIFKRFNPAYPFSYAFVDQKFASKFKDQEQTLLLSFVFSILAIFISCLGLFGLASYVAETRTKEIGVRKVLGASVSGIIGLLSKDFIKLVLLAIVIGSPLAWWAMNNWLENFAYKIEIHWWMFALAGIAAIVIAVLTVSYQAIKAAVANPVDSLRNE